MSERRAGKLIALFLIIVAGASTLDTLARPERYVGEPTLIFPAALIIAALVLITLNGKKK